MEIKSLNSVLDKFTLVVPLKTYELIMDNDGDSQSINFLNYKEKINNKKDKRYNNITTKIILFKPKFFIPKKNLYKEEQSADISNVHKHKRS